MLDITLAVTVTVLDMLHRIRPWTLPTNHMVLPLLR